MKNRKLIIGLLTILVVISFFVGGSYAYFSPAVIGNDNAKVQIVKSGMYEITYESSDYFDVSNIEPGESVSTHFSVKNNSPSTQSNYEISFASVSNTFLNNELVYTLSCTSTSGGACATKTQTVVPKIGGLIATQSSITSLDTHNYTLTLSLVDTGSNQSYNVNKSISFYIYINDTETHAVLGKPSDVLGSYRSSITTITFDLTEDPPAGTINYSGNLDSPSNGLIKWYIVGTNLYIHSKTVMLAPANASLYFYDFNNVTAINNLQYLNTSNTTNLEQFVAYCDKLVSIDLSSFDTSNVTNVRAMFYEDYAIKTMHIESIDLAKSGLNTQYFFQYIPDNASNKGKIYVDDNESAAVACNLLVTAEGTRVSTNEINVGNTLYSCS